MVLGSRIFSMAMFMPVMIFLCRWVCE